MLLSLGMDLPKTILVHGFINSAGQKMSKSLGNVVDPFELVKKYGADAVRFFLLREIPSTEDGDFTEEKFVERYNGDLASGLGNLVARVVTLAQKFEVKNFKDFAIDFSIPKNFWEEFNFGAYLRTVWGFIGVCDKYIEDNRLWEGNKNQGVESLLYAIDKIAELLRPFLPETSEKILKQLKNKKSEPLFPRFK